MAKQGSKSKSIGRHENDISSSDSVYLAAFDTEDDTQGNPYLFCCVHERGNFWAKTRTDFLEKILRLHHEVPSGRKLQLWATNLEYDLVNVFGPELIHQVYLRFGRSYLVSARWRGIEFRDSIRHIQESVAKLGKLVGLPKLDRPIEYAVPHSRLEWDKAIRYCMRDTTITFRAVGEIRSIYSGLGVRTRTTLASTAYHLWEEQYLGYKIPAAPDEIRECSKLAYYGGRTEPFAIGEFNNVTVADISSMYPWAMVFADFPTPWGSIRTIGSDFDISNNNKNVRKNNFIAHADIENIGSIGPLPFRHKSFSTSYPQGTFRGWYVGEELSYAQSLGCKIRIIEGFEFLESFRPFDGYVTDLFRRKNSSRGPLKKVYKLMLNSLYGKFGSQGSRITATPLAEWEENGRPNEWDCRVWNGLVIYRCDAPPPPWGNMLWAAIVTARARIRLHQEIVRLNESGNRVLYCDTDSVFYSGDARYPKLAIRAGDWETKGKYKSLFIAGKKEYILQRSDGTREIHAKGVPFDARLDYILKGNASFSRPTRLLESSRTGIPANTWSKRSKERHVSFSDRIRPDGFLAPIVVRHGEIVSGNRKAVRRGKGKKVL